MRINGGCSTLLARCSRSQYSRSAPILASRVRPAGRSTCSTATAASRLKRRPTPSSTRSASRHPHPRFPSPLPSLPFPVVAAPWFCSMFARVLSQLFVLLWMRHSLPRFFLCVPHKLVPNRPFGCAAACCYGTSVAYLVLFAPHSSRVPLPRRELRTASCSAVCSHFTSTPLGAVVVADPRLQPVSRGAYLRDPVPPLHRRQPLGRRRAASHHPSHHPPLASCCAAPSPRSARAPLRCYPDITWWAFRTTLRLSPGPPTSAGGAVRAARRHWARYVSGCPPGPKGLRREV